MKETEASLRKLQSGPIALIASVILVAALIGCTQPRSPKIADESMAGRLVRISELEADHFVELGSDAPASNRFQKSSLHSKPLLLPAKIQVPGTIHGLLGKLPMQGKVGEKTPIRFRAESEFLFVDRAAGEDESLSAVERGISQTRTIDGKARVMIPTYAIKIEQAGILIPKKNDNGENTTNLELRKTDLQSAEYLLLDLREEAVLSVGFEAKEQQNLAKSLVTPDRIDGVVHEKSDLENLLSRKIIVSPSVEEQKLKLVSKIAKNSSNYSQPYVQIYSVRKRSQIDKSLLGRLDSQVQTAEIENCGDSVRQTLGVDYAQDCILVLESYIQAESVRGKLVQDSSGAPTPIVGLELAESETISLLRVPSGSPMVPQRPEAAVANAIPIDAFKGKEFFLRRTFKNAPITLMSFGPGASGTMDLVRFEFESGRLVVRKVLAVNGDLTPAPIDREEVMSIPARFYQTKTGSGLALAKAIETSPSSADAVILSWANNSIPVGNSPLAFFDAGSCFAAVGHQAVDELDQRLDKGILNFSIRGTYTFKPECMSYFGMNDYWYQGGLQTAYTLEERVSFMVNDGSLDKVPNQNIAFRAQSLMGFGSFTMGTKVPDFAGTTNKVTNETAQPVIHDFRNGKVVNYILGGLPQDTKYRDLIIKGTRQVVKDWNESLHRAFAGTELARSGDYVTLAVDGVDVPAGQLGDLDRSYIWNYEKKLDSNLLGMAQAAPHPRSGYIVTNNVLMYSGNLIAYAAREKESARIVSEYEALKAKILAAGVVAELGEFQVSPGVTPQTNGVRGTVPQPKQIMSGGATLFQGRLSDLIGLQSTPAANSTQVLDQVLGNKNYLHQILKKAAKTQAINDPLLFEALTASEVLKAIGDQLPEVQRQLLALKSRQLALQAEFAKSLSRGPNCFLSAQAAPHSSFDVNKKSVDELFYDWYMATLSHEIGHSLGLTHNFKGSLDKASFEFPGEKTGRVYSSIMDYVHPSVEEYRKPGPYDVHALRAAYTGLIEVADSVIAKAQTGPNNQKLVTVTGRDNQEVQVELVGGTMAKIGDLARVYLPVRTTETGEQFRSWWDMDGRSTGLLPLKPYAFCTDIDVGGDPACQRFDVGTNPSEIVDFLRKDYQQMYPLFYARNSNINMPDFSRYLTRIYMNMYNMRSFLDEGIYLASQGSSQEQYIPYLQAAVKTMFNLTEVIATPSLDEPVFSAKRFYVREVQVPTEDPNKPEKVNILVEKKALRDTMVPGINGAIETRGVELDKIIATMMLASQELGSPRYSRVSLRFSFADFETLAMGRNRSESLTLSLIQGLLSDSVPAIALVNGSTPVSLGRTEKVVVSEGMRSYGVLSATMFLDNTASRDTVNPARAFLVGDSLQNPPNDRFLVTRLGSSLSSPTTLKIWAHDSAEFAKVIVNRAARERVIIDNKDELAKLIDAILTATDETAKGAARAALIQKMNDLNKSGVLLSSQEETQGLNFTVMTTFVENYLGSRAQVVNQVTQLLQNGVSREQIVEQLKSLRNNDENLTREIPILAAATKALMSRAASPEQQEIIGMVVNIELLENHYSELVSNLEIMNRIIHSLHPELSN